MSSSKPPRKWDRQSSSTRYPRSHIDAAGRISAVYVIKIGELHKIGLSVNPTQRIASMTLPGKPDVVLIFWTPKAALLEAMLHKKYAAHREHGEWFRLSKSHIEEIHRVCEAWKKSLE